MKYHQRGRKDLVSKMLVPWMLVFSMTLGSAGVPVFASSPAEEQVGAEGTGLLAEDEDQKAEDALLFENVEGDNGAESGVDEEPAESESGEGGDVSSEAEFNADEDETSEAELDGSGDESSEAEFDGDEEPSEEGSAGDEEMDPEAAFDGENEAADAESNENGEAEAAEPVISGENDANADADVDTETDNDAESYVSSEEFGDAEPAVSGEGGTEAYTEGDVDGESASSTGYTEFTGDGESSSEAEAGEADEEAAEGQSGETAEGAAEGYSGETGEEAAMEQSDETDEENGIDPFENEDAEEEALSESADTEEGAEILGNEFDENADANIDGVNVDDAADIEAEESAGLMEDSEGRDAGSEEDQTAAEDSASEEAGLMEDMEFADSLGGDADASKGKQEETESGSQAEGGANTGRNSSEETGTEGTTESGETDNANNDGGNADADKAAELMDLPITEEAQLSGEDEEGYEDEDNVNTDESGAVEVLLNQKMEFKAGEYYFYLDKDGYVSFPYSSRYDYFCIDLYTEDLILIKDIYVGAGDNLTSYPIGLPKGKYYFELNYSCTLTVNFTASSLWEKELNDSFETANVLSMGSWISGNVYGGSDYYVFDQAQDGATVLSFKHPRLGSTSAYWKYTLYNQDLVEIYSSYLYGNVAEEQSPMLGLPKGKYYIKIVWDDSYSYSYSTYQLMVSSTASDLWEKELNKDLSSANTVAENKWYKGCLWNKDDVDYFRLDTDPASWYLLTFRHDEWPDTKAYWKISLYDNKEKLLLPSASSKGQDKDVKSFVFPGGKACYVKVEAGDGWREQEYSLNMTKLVFDKPVITSIENGRDGIILKWGKVKDPKGFGINLYEVYRKGGSEEDWSLLESTSKRSYTDTSVQNGMTYSYQIKAGSASGMVTDYSAKKSIYRLGSPDISVESLRAVSKGIKISWPKVQGAKSYIIYRRVGSGKWSKLASGKKNAYTDTSVKAGKKYGYRVAAIRGKLSNESKNVTITYVKAPVIKSIKNTSSGIKLTWDKVTGAKEYHIYRKDGSGSYSLIHVTKSRAWTDKDTESGKKYQYAVKASSGFVSVQSPAKSMYHLAVPEMSADYDYYWSDEVELSWTDVGASKYQVYRRKGKGKWKKVKTLSDTEWTDKAAANSQAVYEYKVYALKGSVKTVSPVITVDTR